jgi:hypothetical protein
MTDENEDAQNAEERAVWERGNGDNFDPDDGQWTLVLVQWVDAHSGDEGPGWTDTENYVPGPCVPMTVGWIWPDCKPGYLTLCGTVMNTAFEPETVSGVEHIPLSCVTAVYSMHYARPIDPFTEEIDG